MSTDYSTKIGTYIKVHNPYVDDTESYRGCNNVTCRKYLQGVYSEFCPDCGIVITKISKQIKKQRKFDVYGETNGKLCEEHREYKPIGYTECNFFVPNVIGYGQSIDNKNDAVTYEITSEIIQESINKFKIDFAKEITIIENFFGKDAVEIKYGVICSIW